MPHTDAMRQPLPLQRHPNGDLLLPAEAAQFLVGELRDLQDLLGHEHGRRMEEPGRTETGQETAFRQDAVDQLSAAVGIKAATVPVASMPSTTHTVNHSGALERVNRLCDWLEAAA